jgi:hypothetical protein
MHKVTALFVRSDSCYFDLLFDCWDARRDARLYAGSWPVVAHPPCRGWGRLRASAKPRPDELELAFYAVDAVRRWGGVLEHPYGSTLWPAAQLPKPGEVDQYGGWTVLVDQGWWGHFAPKPTWLYVVGLPRHHLCDLPVDPMRRKGRTLALIPADRERTPLLFAEWLVRLAGRCYVRSGRAVTPVDRLRLPGAARGCYSDLADAVTQDQGELLPLVPAVGYADQVRAVTRGQGELLRRAAASGCK